tara:strand:- start:5170 stop:6498 length:1329 start_codon:yes stop_codon:yes gene_type:complete
MAKNEHFKELSSIKVNRYRTPFLLPKECIPISNSEIREAWCKRRWLLSYGALLNKKLLISSPMNFGIVFHSVMEEVHIYWMKTDGEPYNLKLLSENISKQILSVASEYPNALEQELNDLIERVYEASSAYLFKLGMKPPEGYRVVAVEEELCFPFVDEQKNNILVKACLEEKTSYVSRGDDPFCQVTEWNYAFPFEKSGQNVIDVVLPLYHVGIMDFVLQNKETGKLVIGEMKTSASPDKYGYMFHIDPQISAYHYMLLFAVNNGWLNHKGITGVPVDDPIEGYMLELIYSKKTREPKLLKSGALSKAKNERVCSWKYLSKIKENNLPMEKYEDHILYLKENVDDRFYIRKFNKLSEESLSVFFYHQLSSALKFKNMIENLTYCWESENQYSHIEKNFERTPFCRSSYGCKFYDICHKKLPSDISLDLMGFTKREYTKWTKE